MGKIVKPSLLVKTLVYIPTTKQWLLGHRAIVQFI